jgi:protein-arginine kinase activator protein McsA
MKCTCCGRIQATVQFTIVKGDQTKVQHLCAKCADDLSIAETGRPLERQGVPRRLTCPSSLAGVEQRSPNAAADIAAHDRRLEM